MAGCHVQRDFYGTADGRWVCQGTIECGIEEGRRSRSFVTRTCATREEAEEDALRTAAGLLGNNVDRATSRVTKGDGIRRHGNGG